MVWKYVVVEELFLYLVVFVKGLRKIFSGQAESMTGGQGKIENFNFPQL